MEGGCKNTLGSMATPLRSLSADVNVCSQPDGLCIAIVLETLSFSFPPAQAILMTSDQFIVRRALTNSSFWVFTWVEMSFIVWMEMNFPAS